MRAIAWICAAFTAASILYWLLTARWLGQWMRAGASEADGVDEPPITFFRPLKPRVPSLPEKLRAFVTGSRPGDQVLRSTRGRSIRGDDP